MQRLLYGPKSVVFFSQVYLSLAQLLQHIFSLN